MRVLHASSRRTFPAFVALFFMVASLSQGGVEQLISLGDLNTAPITMRAVGPGASTSSVATKTGNAPWDSTTATITETTLPDGRVLVQVDSELTQLGTFIRLRADL